MRRKGIAVVIVVLAAAVALAATAAARTNAHKAGPITIGWAYDGKGAMAPFDNPALAAAKLRVSKINSRGGVNGRKLVITTCDTQGNKPAVAKACALKLISRRSEHHLHDLRRRSRRAGRAGGDQSRHPRGRAVHRHRSDGAEALRRRRAGSPSASATSRRTRARQWRSTPGGTGWRTAALATDGVIVYFKDVVAAFKSRFTQLGGKIVDQETYHSLGGSDVNNVVSRLNNVKADVVVTSTAGAFGALSTLISGMRSAGNDTPVLNSWAGDGNYWLPKSPPVTNYWFVTYASVFGDDPYAAVNKLAKQVHAGTGGFITGPAAIDGVVTAIRRSGGSTTGSVLASTMEKFRGVPTLSGKVSFTPKLHSVFGRQYRVIRIQDNQPKLVGTVTAKVVAKI